MAYEPETSYKQRVEVAQPTTGERRVVATEVHREPRERGWSTGMVAALVVGAVAVMGLILFFVVGQRDQEHEQEKAALEASERAAQQRAAEQQRPVIVQQPAPAPQQQPVVIQQPAPASQPPVVIQQTAPPPASAPPTSSMPAETRPATTKPPVPDDTTIQAAIDEQMLKDRDLAGLGVTATVINGKVMLMGSVSSSDLKRRVESMVKKVKGVKSVDNQITVINS